MTVYSAAQAARVCQVSLRTVHSRTPQLEAAGAWKDAEGHWHIPVEAMQAAGLSPGRPKPPDSGDDSASRLDDTGTDIVSQLRVEVAVWRLRAEVAENQALECERVIQAHGLKMLETPPAGSGPPPPAPVTTGRSSWFRRRHTRRAQ